MAERYPLFAIYQNAVEKSLNKLVRQRLMLCEDVPAPLTRLVNAGLVCCPANT